MLVPMVDAKKTYRSYSPPYKCKMSVLAIVANATKVDARPNISEGKRWTRLEPR
jgi:hypothetical protein